MASRHSHSLTGAPTTVTRARLPMGLTMKEKLALAAEEKAYQAQLRVVAAQQAEKLKKK